MFRKNKAEFLLYIALTISLIALLLSSYNFYAINKSYDDNSINLDEFLGKLTAHAEMGDYQTVSPINIIQVNSNNLATLSSQIAGLDETFIGDFIIEYTDKIIVYDYENDEIKADIVLENTPQLPADFAQKLNSHPEMEGLASEQPSGGILDQITLDTLKQQYPETYQDAQAGDYLLRYNDRLIIYRYEADQIIGAFGLTE